MFDWIMLLISSVGFFVIVLLTLISKTKKHEAFSLSSFMAVVFPWLVWIFLGLFLYFGSRAFNGDASELWSARGIIIILSMVVASLNLYALIATVKKIEEPVFYIAVNAFNCAFGLSILIGSLMRFAS